MILNKEQENVVNTISGPVLVVSCAGSGKTTVIINRLHKMIESGISEDNIAVVSFTKESAEQMYTRYTKEFGTCNVFFGTIHSLCLRILSEETIYNSKNLISNYEQYQCIREVIKNKIEKEDINDFIIKVLTNISYVKNKDIDYRQYTPENYKKEIFCKAFIEYEKYKTDNNKMDFDDILILCRNLFKTEKNILSKWQERIQHIMIDEYQDTNQIQADIFYMLAEKYRNICVVGDDDQSIYGFRSADPQIMLSFPKCFPDCKKINLSTNYRCPKNILQYAEKSILHNENRFEKQLCAYNKNDGIIQFCHVDKEMQQAELVRNLIIEEYKNGIKFEDMAVLYRTNTESQLPISAFLCSNIPFYSTGTCKSIYEEFIFKDIEAYYRLSRKNGVYGDLQRIINRPARYIKQEVIKGLVNLDVNKIIYNIKKTSQQNYRSHFSKYDEIYELQSHLNRMSEIEEPREFMFYLLYRMNYQKFIFEYCEFSQKDPQVIRHNLELLQDECTHFTTMKDWFAYTQYIRKNMKINKDKKKKEGVCLSTLHAAKGLEWKTVFLIDCNDGYLPCTQVLNSENKNLLEEERRLFYVGMTRAKNHLYLISTNQKPISRFIREIKSL